MDFLHNRLSRLWLSWNLRRRIATHRLSETESPTPCFTRKFLLCRGPSSCNTIGATATRSVPTDQNTVAGARNWTLGTRRKAMTEPRNRQRALKIGVVVSGLPASGKTQIGRELATALNFVFLDKDDFLEELYDRSSVASLDDRNRLSRLSDRLFRDEAIRSGSAVLVSHWCPPDAQDQSGTPSHWMAQEYDAVVEVYCLCEPDEACRRFFARQRHLGHLDDKRDREELALRMASWLGRYPLGVGAVVKFRTDQATDPGHLIQQVREEINLIRLQLSDG